MPTAVGNTYVLANIGELEPAPRLAPGATDDGRRRFDVRRTLDITAFGVSAFSAPSGVVVISEHDETLLGEAGQEELYLVVNGAATFEIDGETVEAPTGTLVNVPPTAKRKAMATDEDLDSSREDQRFVELATYPCCAQRESPAPGGAFSWQPRTIRRRRPRTRGSRARCPRCFAPRRPSRRTACR